MTLDDPGETPEHPAAVRAKAYKAMHGLAVWLFCNTTSLDEVIAHWEDGAALATVLMAETQKARKAYAELRATSVEKLRFEESKRAEAAEAELADLKEYACKLARALSYRGATIGLAEREELCQRGLEYGHEEL